eukprot:SAG31_NODE_26383_length_443_cov_1.037791_1_plen_51_part_10
MPAVKVLLTQSYALLQEAGTVHRMLGALATKVSFTEEDYKVAKVASIFRHY